MSKAKMTKVLSTKRYDDWEANINEKALELATEFIADYNSNVRNTSWTVEQSKVVTEYTLMKVWHICSCSGILLIYKITKIKNKCKIVIDFHEQDEQYVD